MPKKTTAKAGTTPAQGRYGGPGKGLTFPPYYRPTPSVKSGTTFFPTARSWVMTRCGSRSRARARSRRA